MCRICCIITPLFFLAYLRLTSRFSGLPQNDNLATVGSLISSARIGRGATANVIRAIARPTNENHSTGRHLCTRRIRPIITFRQHEFYTLMRSPRRLPAINSFIHLPRFALFVICCSRAHNGEFSCAFQRE